ncbi:MAG: amidase, partial [Alphaproteobacteria bacterium]
GGSAAAVAARLVPVAHATDGGGSIRIPASNCGLVGLKPTRARNPAGPLVGEGWSGLSAAHIVSRSVRDCAAVLDVTSGPAEGDPYLAPAPLRSFATEVGRDPGKLRIAVQTGARNGVAVDPECVAATESVAKLCAELGHHVDIAPPEYDFDAMFESLWVLAGAAVTNAVEIRLAQLGRALRDDDLEPMTMASYRRGKSDPIYLYVKALTTAHAIGRQMASFFNKFDVTLSPVTANPALPIGARPNMAEGDLTKFLGDLYRQIPFTPLYNVSGCPALSVPLYWSESGIPIGVQLGAAYGREDTLFRLAGQLEAARPSADKMPLVAM